jgi:UbiA prenyltransferase family
MAFRVHLRSLLVLGRVSNLPTVWSNCLAAWLLNGGVWGPNFFLLGAGATLLYTGGMFLNDAFDVEFDRQHRRERPIPSGKISVSAVWLFGVSFLLFGWLLILQYGLLAAIAALLLVATILIYDAIHKRTPFAPLLMAACRFLLYFVAAAATLNRMSDVVLWHGLALAAYVTGLSFLARGESGQGRGRRWPLLLLIAPLVADGLVNPHRSALAWVASACLAGWLLWCLRGILKRPVQNVGRSVAGLLAGIALVDGAALSELTTELALVFAGLFVLALILQRRIPAT